MAGLPPSGLYLNLSSSEFLISLNGCPSSEVTGTRGAKLYFFCSNNKQILRTLGIIQPKRELCSPKKWFFSPLNHLVIKYILNSNPQGGYRGTKSFMELRLSSREKLISKSKLGSGIKQYKVFVSQNCKGFGDLERGRQPDKLGNIHRKKGN